LGSEEISVVKKGSPPPGQNQKEEGKGIQYCTKNNAIIVKKRGLSSQTDQATRGNQTRFEVE
jgi:hypothetical protein